MNHTKNLLVLFVLALLVRLTFSFLVAYRVGNTAFEDLRAESDAGQYIALAKSIVTSGNFRLYGYPHTFRTPGYPAWLAFWYSISRSWFFSVAVVGSILGALATCLIYIVGSNFLSRGAAFAASILFALEPYGVHMAARPMTESLYAFLMALFAFLIVKLYTRENAHTLLYSFLAGLLAGLLILVRPQMWPFFIVLSSPILFLTLRNRRSPKESFLAAILFILAAFLVVVPWMARNWRFFGQFDVSSQGGWNLYFYDAKRFTGANRFYGLDDEEIPQYLAKDLGYNGPSDIRSIVYQPIYYHKAFQIILANPVRYTLWHVKESLIFFYDDGLRDMLRHVRASLPPLSLRNALRNPFLLFVPLWAFSWLCVFFLAGLGVWEGARDRALRPAFLFLAFTVLYVPLVAGTLAVARFRFAMTPIIFLLAVFGIKEFFSRRGAHESR